jgi:hypothetical protein
MTNAKSMHKREIETIILFSHEISSRVDDKQAQKRIAEATVDEVLRKVDYIEEYAQSE